MRKSESKRESWPYLIFIHHETKCSHMDVVMVNRGFGEYLAILYVRWLFSDILNTQLPRRQQQA